MMTRAGLDLQLREAYARAGQPMPAEPARGLRWHGNRQDARDMLIIAATLAVVVGAFAVVLARVLATGPQDDDGGGRGWTDDDDDRTPPPAPGGLSLGPFTIPDSLEGTCVLQPG